MCERVDKGFEINYNKLSYRRRFIRTLWMLLQGVVVLVLMYFWKRPWYSIVITGVIIAIVGTIQAAYNYKLWKKEEAGKKKSEQTQ